MPIRPNLLFTAAARDPVILGWAGTRAWHDEIPPVCADEWGLYQRPAVRRWLGRVGPPH